ncbi:MAG: hypothetical protein NC346_04575 [Prevotella sp.]|nr:hypothetical protein [Bacteroidales bacterium]MCM1069147.1 hypothetical protein [Prevotella sp.]
MKRYLLCALFCACAALATAQKGLYTTSLNAQTVSYGGYVSYQRTSVFSQSAAEGWQTPFCTDIKVCAAVPDYVPAHSGDLNPFDAVGTVARRNGPPTTGGGTPKTPI